MSSINSITLAQERAAAAVRAALTELSQASTPAQLAAAQARLAYATDRLIAANQRAAVALSSGSLRGMRSASYYGALARHAQAALVRTGFAPSTHIACPNSLSPEARQRLLIGRMLRSLQALSARIEEAMRRLASQVANNPPAALGTTGRPSSDPDLLSIINNPHMTIEDKLSLFLAKYVEKHNAEIQKKMEELAAAKSGQATSQGSPQGASSKKGSGLGGIFKGIGGFFKKLVKGLPKLTKMAGSIIGGIYGGPAGAAVGGTLGSVAGNALGSLTGSASSQGTGGTQSTQGGQGGTPDTTKLEAELQRLTQKREQLVKLLSDLMASLHQTNMAVIRNIRG